MQTHPSQYLQDKARELQSRAGPQIEEAQKSLAEMNAQALKFIKERPGTCLMGALALGFVIGRIASR